MFEVVFHNSSPPDSFLGMTHFLHPHPQLSFNLGQLQTIARLSIKLRKLIGFAQMTGKMNKLFVMQISNLSSVIQNEASNLPSGIGKLQKSYTELNISSI